MGFPVPRPPPTPRALPPVEIDRPLRREDLKTAGDWLFYFAGPVTVIVIAGGIALLIVARILGW